MAGFSGSDAALEGFRLTRREPRAVLTWAVALLLLNLVSTALIIGLMGETLNEMMVMEPGAEPTPAEALAMLGSVSLLMLIALPLSVLIFSVFTGAVYRAVLRPEDRRMAYLRLGADEARLAVVWLALWLLSFVITLVAVFGVGVIAGLIGAAAGGGGAGDAIGGALTAIVLFFGLIAFALAFWTKFSFAAPMTFVDRRIRIFESWKATKGQFWPLLGTYVIAAVLGAVVSLLGWVISLAVMTAFGGMPPMGMGMAQGGQPDFSSLGAFFTPANTASMVVGALFSTLTYVIWLAPPAVAYRDIHGVTPRPKA